MITLKVNSQVPKTSEANPPLVFVKARVQMEIHWLYKEISPL